MGLEVDYERGRGAAATTARCGSGPTRCRSTAGAVQAVARRDRGRASSRTSCCAAGATT